MSHFFDYLALLIIILLAFIGYKRGFLEELSRLISLIISSLIALKFYEPLSTRLPFSEPTVSMIAFLAIFLTTLICLRFLMRSFQIFMLSKGIRSSNKALGFIFGSLKGLLAVIVILWVVDIAPNPKYFDNFKKRSFVYRYFSGYRHKIVTLFGIEGAVDEGEAWVKEKINPNKESAE